MKITTLKARLIALSFCFFGNGAVAQIYLENHSLDVLNYHVQIEPDIAAKKIEGNAVIKFAIDQQATKVIFDCGDLEITDIKGSVVESYKQDGKKLIISLSEDRLLENEIQIFYKGSPSRGVVFLSDPLQMYTVYFTSEWMVCNNDLKDKATIQIDLIVSDYLEGIASGVLRETKIFRDSLVMHSWRQDYGTPAYTYGFAIGSFNEFKDESRGISLNYYSHNHSLKDLKIIFDKTADMLKFFEDKSGVAYTQNTYTQILVGRHYQEMSGFAVLKNSYGNLVLKDSTETNLISHELAHQWWGNMITCESLSHFWLNEGFATYMSAAYNEHRFGQEKYMENIDSYYQVYNKIKQKGADKPLVFDNWLNPTPDDRNLVYFKGAYVLHLLREELGNQDFWEGIKFFSQKYYGKSVSTENLQKALEESSKKDLDNFFEKWIY